VLAVIWILAGFAIYPVLRHWTPPPPSPHRTHIAIDLSYLLTAFICLAMYRLERRRLDRRHALTLVFLVFLLSSFVNKIHNFNVDRAANYIPTIPNETLQEKLQASVIQLSPGVVPHSYRFLPNALVLWMQLGGVRFDAARDIYRLLVGLLLFYVIYRFACLYTTFTGAVMAMLLVCVVYPITFELYIGQLTDPLSHLSFLLAFLFLETGDFACLLTSLLLGSLAKETVLALAGFYAVFCRKEKNYLAKATTLCVTSAAIFLGVRQLVLHGGLDYGNISGTSLAHIGDNWRDTKWQGLFLITAAAYLPFLALGWKDTPLLLKRLIFYLILVLFVSSLLFSWLSETRNYMPLVFVLAVVTARYLCGPSKNPEPGMPSE